MCVIEYLHSSGVRIGLSGITATTLSFTRISPDSVSTESPPSIYVLTTCKLENTNKHSLVNLVSVMTLYNNNNKILFVCSSVKQALYSFDINVFILYNEEDGHVGAVFSL